MQKAAATPTADDWEEVCATIGICGKRRPIGQAAVIRALLGAMGAARGPQPDLRAVAAALGVSHQTLYASLARLEAKGVVVRRRQRTLEIRLG